MRTLLTVICAAALLSQAAAQAPGEKAKKEPGKEPTKDFSTAPIVVKMMAFNKKKDGKLTKDEVTDERLHRLFDRADTNKDGVVTKEELMALAAKLEAEAGQGGQRGGFGDRGPGDRGPGDRGPGERGPGGRGFGGPPQPGQVLSSGFQDLLKLTAEQKKQMEALQKEVDSKLDKILTDEQKKQLKEMRDRGPGRPGPGSPGGPGERGNR